jgi:hypothetical protein
MAANPEPMSISLDFSVRQSGAFRLWHKDREVVTARGQGRDSVTGQA